jgi:hypothetical protein
MSTNWARLMGQHGISLLYDKEYKSRLEMHHSKQSKVALKNEPTF